MAVVAVAAAGKAVWLLGAAALAALGGAAWFWSDPEPEAAQLPQPSAQIAAAPSAEPVEAVAMPSGAEPAAAAAIEGGAPRFDVVRVSPDGQALIAGKAAPQARVQLLLDGVEVMAVAAGASGEFVAMFDLPPSERGQMLSLVAQLGDAAPVMATEQILLTAPRPAVAAQSVVESAEPIAEPVVAATAEAEVARAEAPVSEAAMAQAPVLKLGPEGVSVVAGVSEAPRAVSVEAISYTESGEVVLAGVGAADAALRIYLDQAPIGDYRVNAQNGWEAQLPDIAPGVYQLRVDQLGEDGKVLSRFETPFKREAVADLRAVVAEAQVAPAAEREAAASVAAAPAEAAVTNTAPEVVTATAAPVLTVTVQPGYTLWGIANEALGSGLFYVQVFEANRAAIRDPDLIYPGQVFTLPQPVSAP